MKYGFTAYEVQALRPNIVLVREKRPDYSALGIWTLVITVATVLLINSFLLPMTVAHADTKLSMMSDREQETLYCQLWKQGTPVQNATNTQITNHCAKFL
jgi:hypothetical protein